MATTPISIHQAVRDAVTAQTTEETTETPVQTTEEPTTEETTEQSLEVNASPEEITQALEMYRTLSDPVKAKEFVKSLGLSEVKDKTPAQVTETVLDILRESLGDENSDLAERLAPALEKLIAKEVRQPVQQMTVDQQVKEAKAEVDQLFVTLGEELPEFNNLQNEMSSVMKQIAPQKGVSMRDYMTQVYKLAGGKMPTNSNSNSSSTNKTTKTTVKSVVDKMVKNAQEAKTNVSSGVDTGENSTKAPQKLSARQAVMQAVNELQGKK